MKRGILLRIVCAFLTSTFLMSVNAGVGLSIIGSATKGEWTTDLAYHMLESSEDQEVYTYSGYFKANEGFKFITKGEYCNFDDPENVNYEYACDRNFDAAGNGKLLKRETAESSDDKFTLPEEGNYLITCNLNTLEITAVKLSYQEKPVYYNALYAIGDATSASWNLADAVMLPAVEGEHFKFSGILNLTAGEGKDFKLATLPFNGKWGQVMFVKAPDSETNILSSESGADDLKWSVSQEGAYKVTVDLENMTIVISEDTGTAVAFAPVADIKVSASGNIFSVDGLDDRVKNVYNIQGKLVCSFSENTINMSVFPAGIYILKSGSNVIKLSVR